MEPSARPPCSPGCWFRTAGNLGRSVLSAPPPNLEGEILQRIRGLIAGSLVGFPLGVFLLFTLHATREAGALIGVAVGLAIFVVVATGTDARDQIAEAAWREAAPDLPPVSDRIALEQSQATMPGPQKQRRTSGRSHDDRQRAQPSDPATQGVEPR